MAEIEIDATVTKPTTNSKDYFPLLNLPNSVINLIVSYHVPYPLFVISSSDVLAEKLLPLALTCTKLFDLITAYIPQFIQQDHMFMLMIICYTKDSPSGNKFLYRAARLALNKMLHSSIPESEIDLKSEQYETQSAAEDNCNEKTPLFSIEGHTESCRVRLAWITLAAYSNQLSQLRFFPILLRPEDHQSCALRLLTLLKFSIKKLQVTSAYPCTTLSQQITHKFMAVSNVPLVDLTVDISNVMWLKCIRSTHLPNLRNLSLNVYNKLHGYSRDVIRQQLIKVLSALNRHGTKLEKLAVSSLHFLSLEEKDEPINLESLAPTVQHLHLTNYHPWTDGENDFEKSLNHCGKIETLEFKDFSLSMERINNAMKAGFLRSLKRIMCTRLRSIIVQDHLKEDSSFLELMGLVEKLSIHNAMNANFLESFQDSFPSLRSLSFRIHERNILKFCQFIKQADHLVSLSIYLEPDDNGCPVMDYEAICTDNLYYSSHIIDLVMERSSCLEEIQLFGFYVTVEDSMTILRNMGKRAKVFRIPLSDEFHAYNDYMYLSHYEISASGINRVLDVIIENCPNIEKLFFTSIFTWRRWRSRDVRRVAFKVKSLMRKAAAFEPWSMTLQFGMNQDDRIYAYRYSRTGSSSEE